MTPEELNRAIIYARGWNEGLQAAIKVIERNNCGECDYAKIYVREIRKLDKSIKATDD